MDDWMQVRDLFEDRFCFRPLAVRGANSQKGFTQARSRDQSKSHIIP